MREGEGGREERRERGKSEGGEREGRDREDDG